MYKIKKEDNTNNNLRLILCKGLKKLQRYVTPKRIKLL